MLSGLDFILAVFEIDQHEMSLLRADFLPAFQSGLQSFRLDLLQKRMRVHDFHSSQIGEGSLQAVAQLTLNHLWIGPRGNADGYNGMMFSRYRGAAGPAAKAKAPRLP